MCTIRYTVILDTRMIEATSATVRNRTSARRSFDMVTSELVHARSAGSPGADWRTRAGATIGAVVTTVKRT
ncbi:hypothetical protein GCM10027055_10320 [Janibacter alkaliphilus]